MHQNDHSRQLGIEEMNFCAGGTPTEELQSRSRSRGRDLARCTGTRRVPAPEASRCPEDGVATWRTLPTDAGGEMDLSVAQLEYRHGQQPRRGWEAARR